MAHSAEEKTALTSSRWDKVNPQASTSVCKTAAIRVLMKQLARQRPSMVLSGICSGTSGRSLSVLGIHQDGPQSASQPEAQWGATFGTNLHTGSEISGHRTCHQEIYLHTAARVLGRNGEETLST